MGLLYPRLNFLLASGIVSIYSGLTTLAVPFCPSINSLLLTFGLYGIGFGFYDTGCNVYLLQLWGENASPFLQGLQLMYGVGSLVAPLIAEPFLLNGLDQELEGDGDGGRDLSHPCVVSALNYSEPGHQNDGSYLLAPTVSSRPETRLFFPYAILSALIFFNAVLFFVVWVACPADQRCTAGDTGPEESERRLSSRSLRLQRLCSAVIVILVLVFLHIYLGIEVSVGSFLLTYAVHSEMRLSKSEGAFLTTLFWMTFTFTKLAVALIVQKVGNERLIWGSLVLVLCSNGLLVLSSSKLELIVGVAFLGIGISGMFGCMFGYLQQHVRVTSAIASAIVVAATLGEFSFPFLISYFMDSEPDVLLWVSTAAGVSMTLLFVAITLTCRLKQRFR